MKHFCSLLTASAAAACLAHAQCDQWTKTQDSVYAGVPGQAVCVASWDPDGPGPLAARAVVGNLYYGTSNDPSPRIDVFDGVRWSILGSINISPLSLAVFRNDLYVAGAESTDGVTPPGVFHWTGTQWERVLNPDAAATPAAVTHLTVWNDRLIAAGSFTSIGGSAANRIAAWDGTRWSPLGAGLPAATTGLAVFQNNLYAGAGTLLYMFNPDETWSSLPQSPLNGVRSVRGSTSRGVCETETHYLGAGHGNVSVVSFWNGSQWSDSTGFVRNLSGNVCEFRDGDYLACPEYIYHGVQNGAIILVGGANASRNPVAIAKSSCYAICAHAGGVLAAGVLTELGGAPGVNVAWFSGTTWKTLGPGFPTRHIVALAGDDEDLYVGSSYSDYEAQRDVYQVYRRHNGVVTRILQPTGGLNSLCQTPAGVFASHSGQVQQYNGIYWTTMPNPGSVAPSRLIEFRGELLAATSVGLFRYSQGWVNITTTPITTMAVGGDNLFVGGSFTSINGVTASRIARWDGAQFSPLGDGLEAAPFDITTDGARAWVCLNRQVREFSGSAWTVIGEVPSLNGDWIGKLKYSRERLYAIGSFSQMNGVNAADLAVWDGHQWQPMTAGAFATTINNAMLEVGNDLLFTGQFHADTNEPWNPIARWGRAPSLPRSDIDCNGGVDGSDVSAFFDLWERGSVLADINDDGAVDGTDSADFFYLWEQGR
ncbi:MAG: hypothetical protein JSR77_03005 [Planctomycetes bacterium]|nr:hypothetical protein [Planctomycetota bacterium]